MPERILRRLLKRTEIVSRLEAPIEGSSLYDVWNRSPLSVTERRMKFLRTMGLSLDATSMVNSAAESREMSDEEASTATEGFYSSRSSISSYPSDTHELAEKLGSNSSFETKVRSSNTQKEKETGNPKHFKFMIRRLRSMSCIFYNQGNGLKFMEDDDDGGRKLRIRRVKVRQWRKKLKELSAVYTGHDIQAHEGAILAMKFSLDGQYLASGGEDGIVKIWKVIETERFNDADVPEFDRSCVYFSVNQLSELKPLLVHEEKLCNPTSLKRNSESACVVFPPKIFRILEKPLHEFRGHSCEVLDLSWSRSNYLLSSSVDKTVRLWQVGREDCLKVFSHSNYVTCVHFNPVDENYFMSGSIDGKVRIWGVSCAQVVDWTDIREIVTAVCFRPDGQGSVVGSLDGSCRFYNISENHLQFDYQICLHSKKKTVCKKITSFQFLPQDSSMVMVSSADSRIRILHGPKVVRKYKGIRAAGNHIAASFTRDGKYIISASADSNVYVWNSGDQIDSASSRARKSFENFSTNASIAIPWSGLEKNLTGLLPFSSTPCFSLNQECCLESLPKGSATWPEEKLPTSMKASRMHKSRYKFLEESSQNACGTWGLVIVTAGWDGHLRSFHSYGLPAPV